MPTIEKLCRVEALEPGRLLAKQVGEIAIAVFRSGDAFHAFEDRCPHRGARLSAGIVYDGCKVACPDHGWSIDIPTGRVEAPEQGQVRRFEVEVREGWVWVRMDSPSATV